MSRAPLVLPKSEKPFQAGDLTLSSTTLGWRMVNPRMDPDWTVSLGEATERLREKHGISRQRQDAFAERSHRLAAQAWDAGFYDNQVVSVPGVELTRDESIRPDTTVSGSPHSRRRSVRRTERSPPVTPPLSMTALPRRCSDRPMRQSFSAAIRWPESRAAVPRRANRSTSATPRWTPPTAHSSARDLVVRHRRGRTQRGVRRPVPGVHRCVGHRSANRQSARWSVGDRPPARGFGHSRPGDAGPQPATKRWPLRCRGDLYRCWAGLGRGAGERVMRATVASDADAAVADIRSGATVLIGGFGWPASRSS